MDIVIAFVHYFYTHMNRTAETNQGASSQSILLPPDMAVKAVDAAVQKTYNGSIKTAALSLLAGAFIALGAIFSTLATSGSSMDYGIAKLIAGLTFSLGLILVVAGGAELFTGNNLMVMARASHRITSRQLLTNWILVYFGNMAGAFSLVLLILISGHHFLGEGVVGANILNIASAKCQLGFIQALSLGILCNILVCLAIWLSYSATSLTGKILAILFPVTAFVAAGFEHSVANMYFIPAGIMVKNYAAADFWTMIQQSPADIHMLNWKNYFLSNLLPVSIGNIIGGALFVGAAYWFIYLSKWSKPTSLPFKQT